MLKAERPYSGYIGFLKDAKEHLKNNKPLDAFDSINRAIDEYTNGVELYEYRIKICNALIENDKAMIREILPEEELNINKMVQTQAEC